MYRFSVRSRVIKSFADRRTAALFAGHAVRDLPNQMQRRARAKLLAIDAAKQLDDLRIPPGNRLEALHSDRRGQYSIRINDQWRICFEWREDAAWNVEVVDYQRDEIMNIKREDVDAGRVDFAEVITGKKLPPIHPGEILRDEFLEPMKISVYALAQAIKVPRSRVNDIVLGRRGITADTAFRLARYFGTTPELWINLQARYDLDVANRTLRHRIEREVRPRAA